MIPDSREPAIDARHLAPAGSHMARDDVKSYPLDSVVGRSNRPHESSHGTDLPGPRNAGGGR